MASTFFETAEQLEQKIEEYISLCNECDPIKPLTYTGLAYHLGFASRQSIWEYSKRSDELSLPIKRAMLRIEQSYEESLHGTSPAGSIFALKNRGWSDKTELKHSGSVKHELDYSRMTDKELQEIIENEE